MIELLNTRLARVLLIRPLILLTICFFILSIISVHYEPFYVSTIFGAILYVFTMHFPKFIADFLSNHGFFLLLFLPFLELSLAYELFITIIRKIRALLPKI